MTRGRLVRLGIRVHREQAELALAALLPVLQHGAEESEPDAGTVEYALYAPAGELPADETIRALAGDALVGVARSEVPEGWERRWHEHLQPVEIASGGRRLRVRPPWEPAGGEQDVLEIVIDPGELFGAGTHATTQLCLELLLELACAGERGPLGEGSGGLCDWGAGSGILAIAAARLGFAPVAAVELVEGGPDAIRRNAAANGVAVNVVRADLTASEPPWAPTVTANLTLDVLHAIAPRLTQPTSSASAGRRPPERLIASGMLAERAGEVAEAFSRHGLVEAERRVQGEWAAVLLEAE